MGYVLFAQMLLFDCFYDEFRGVICLVEVVQGRLIKGERITSKATGKSYEVLDVSEAVHPTGVDVSAPRVPFACPGGRQRVTYSDSAWMRIGTLGLGTRRQRTALAEP